MLLPPLPLLHASPPAGTPFFQAWSFDPLVAAGLLVTALLYGLGLRRLGRSGRRPLPPWQAAAFYAGLLLVAFALLGPPDAFNADLFSLHMVQHLALMELAAPLLLLGRPVQLALRAIPARRSASVARAIAGNGGVRGVLTGLTLPFVGTVLFNLNLIVWHVPAFYDAALGSEALHVLEHGLFFGTALIFWWPIIDPVPRHHRAHPAWALGGVFASMVVGMGLGAILTLSGSVIYPSYQSSPKPWGLSALEDQQIGGLTMWVAGGLIYTGILIALLVRTFGTGDAEPLPAPPARASEPG